MGLQPSGPSIVWSIAHQNSSSLIPFQANTGTPVAAIAAALAGAEQVSAIDIDPDARAAIQRNAELNGVEVETPDEIPKELELLLAADVCYQEANRGLLRAHSRRGLPGLVSDPGRWALPMEILEPLASFEVGTLPIVDDDPSAIFVYRLRTA